MTTASPVTVRRYRDADRDALRDICMRTGYLGGDARPHYRDPEILPALFAEPYAALDPDLVFVADDGERVIGYLVGAADTAAFFAAFRARWLPLVGPRFPAPEGPPETMDEVMRDLLHHAERMLIPEIVTDYPAHLHIDLLPQGQRRGLGTRLMRAYFDALGERGVPGVHLGMHPGNTGARVFYERLGFAEVDAPGVEGEVVYLARRLPAA